MPDAWPKHPLKCPHEPYPLTPCHLRLLGPYCSSFPYSAHCPCSPTLDHLTHWVAMTAFRAKLPEELPPSPASSCAPLLPPTHLTQVVPCP